MKPPTISTFMRATLQKNQTSSRKLDNDIQQVKVNDLPSHMVLPPKPRTFSSIVNCNFNKTGKDNSDKSLKTMYHVNCSPDDGDISRKMVKTNDICSSDRHHDKNTSDLLGFKRRFPIASKLRHIFKTACEAKRTNVKEDWPDNLMSSLNKTKGLLPVETNRNIFMKTKSVFQHLQKKAYVLQGKPKFPHHENGSVSEKMMTKVIPFRSIHSKNSQGIDDYKMLNIPDNRSMHIIDHKAIASNKVLKMPKVKVIPTQILKNKVQKNVEKIMYSDQSKNQEFKMDNTLTRASGKSDHPRLYQNVSKTVALASNNSLSKSKSTFTMTDVEFLKANNATSKLSEVNITENHLKSKGKMFTVKNQYPHVGHQIKGKLYNPKFTKNFFKSELNTHNFINPPPKESLHASKECKKPLVKGQGNNFSGTNKMRHESVSDLINHNSQFGEGVSKSEFNTHSVTDHPPKESMEDKISDLINSKGDKSGHSFNYSSKKISQVSSKKRQKPLFKGKGNHSCGINKMRHESASDLINHKEDNSSNRVTYSTSKILNVEHQKPFTEGERSKFTAMNKAGHQLIIDELSQSKAPRDVNKLIDYKLTSLSSNKTKEDKFKSSSNVSKYTTNSNITKELENKSMVKVAPVENVEQSSRGTSENGNNELSIYEYFLRKSNVFIDKNNETKRSVKKSGNYDSKEGMRNIKTTKSESLNYKVELQLKEDNIKVMDTNTSAGSKIKIENSPNENMKNRKELIFEKVLTKKPLEISRAAEHSNKTNKQKQTTNIGEQQNCVANLGKKRKETNAKTVKMNSVKPEPIGFINNESKLVCNDVSKELFDVKLNKPKIKFSNNNKAILENKNKTSKISNFVVDEIVFKEKPKEVTENVKPCVKNCKVNKTVGLTTPRQIKVSDEKTKSAAEMNTGFKFSKENKLLDPVQNLKTDEKGKSDSKEAMYIPQQQSNVLFSCETSLLPEVKNESIDVDPGCCSNAGLDNADAEKGKGGKTESFNVNILDIIQKISSVILNQPSCLFPGKTLSSHQTVLIEQKNPADQNNSIKKLLVTVQDVSEESNVKNSDVKLNIDELFSQSEGISAPKCKLTDDCTEECTKPKPTPEWDSTITISNTPQTLAMTHCCYKTAKMMSPCDVISSKKLDKSVSSCNVPTPGLVNDMINVLKLPSQISSSNIIPPISKLVPSKNNKANPVSSNTNNLELKTDGEISSETAMGQLAKNVTKSPLMPMSIVATPKNVDVIAEKIASQKASFKQVEISKDKSSIPKIFQNHNIKINKSASEKILTKALPPNNNKITSNVSDFKQILMNKKKSSISNVPPPKRVYNMNVKNKKTSNSSKNNINITSSKLEEKNADSESSPLDGKISPSISSLSEEHRKTESNASQTYTTKESLNRVEKLLNTFSFGALFNKTPVNSDSVDVRDSQVVDKHSPSKKESLSKVDYLVKTLCPVSEDIRAIKELTQTSVDNPSSVKVGKEKLNNYVSENLLIEEDENLKNCPKRVALDAKNNKGSITNVQILSQPISPSSDESSKKSLKEEYIGINKNITLKKNNSEQRGSLMNQEESAPPLSPHQDVIYFSDPLFSSVTPAKHFEKSSSAEVTPKYPDSSPSIVLEQALSLPMFSLPQANNTEDDKKVNVTPTMDSDQGIIYLPAPLNSLTCNKIACIAKENVKEATSNTSGDQDVIYLSHPLFSNSTISNCAHETNVESVTKDISVTPSTNPKECVIYLPPPLFSLTPVKNLRNEDVDVKTVPCAVTSLENSNNTEVVSENTNASPPPDSKPLFSNCGSSINVKSDNNAESLSETPKSPLLLPSKDSLKDIKLLENKGVMSHPLFSSNEDLRKSAISKDSSLVQIETGVSSPASGNSGNFTGVPTQKTDLSVSHPLFSSNKSISTQTFFANPVSNVPIKFNSYTHSLTSEEPILQSDVKNKKKSLLQSYQNIFTEHTYPLLNTALLKPCKKTDNSCLSRQKSSSTTSDKSDQSINWKNKYKNISIHSVAHKKSDPYDDTELTRATSIKILIPILNKTKQFTKVEKNQKKLPPRQRIFKNTTKFISKNEKVASQTKRYYRIRTKSHSPSGKWNDAKPSLLKKVNSSDCSLFNELFVKPNDKEVNDDILQSSNKSKPKIQKRYYRVRANTNHLKDQLKGESYVKTYDDKEVRKETGYDGLKYTNSFIDPNIWKCALFNKTPAEFNKDEKINIKDSTDSKRSILDLFRTVDKTAVIIEKDFYTRDKIFKKIQDDEKIEKSKVINKTVKASSISGESEKSAEYSSLLTKNIVCSQENDVLRTLDNPVEMSELPLECGLTPDSTDALDTAKNVITDKHGLSLCKTSNLQNFQQGKSDCVEIKENLLIDNSDLESSKFQPSESGFYKFLKYDSLFSAILHSECDTEKDTFCVKDLDLNENIVCPQENDVLTTSNNSSQSKTNNLIYETKCVNEELQEELDNEMYSDCEPVLKITEKTRELDDFGNVSFVDSFTLPQKASNEINVTRNIMSNFWYFNNSNNDEVESSDVQLSPELCDSLNNYQDPLVKIMEFKNYSDSVEQINFRDPSIISNLVANITNEEKSIDKFAFCRCDDIPFGSLELGCLSNLSGSKIKEPSENDSSSGLTVNDNFLLKNDGSSNTTPSFPIDKSSKSTSINLKTIDSQTEVSVAENSNKIEPGCSIPSVLKSFFQVSGCSSKMKLQTDLIEKTKKDLLGLGEISNSSVVEQGKNTISESVNMHASNDLSSKGKTLPGLLCHEKKSDSKNVKPMVNVSNEYPVITVQLMLDEKTKSNAIKDDKPKLIASPPPSENFDQSVEKMRKNFIFNTFKPDSKCGVQRLKSAFEKTSENIEIKEEKSDLTGTKIIDYNPNNSPLNEKDYKLLESYFYNKNNNSNKKILTNKPAKKSYKYSPKNHKIKKVSKPEIAQSIENMSKFKEVIEKYANENYMELSQYTFSVVSPSEFNTVSKPFVHNKVSLLSEVSEATIDSYSVLKPKAEQSLNGEQPGGIINLDLLANPILREKYSSIPSVSKILNQTMSDSGKTALDKWKSKMIESMGEDKFIGFYQEQLDRGKEFHEIVKNQLLGKTDITEKQRSNLCYKSLEQIMGDISSVVAVESFVVHPALGYKGIFDCVAVYKGKPCLIEWKHTSKRKNKIGSTYDAPLQMSAYVGALSEDKNYNIQVENGLIVVAHADGSPADVFELNLQEIQKYWTQWLQRLKQYATQENNS